MYDRAWYAARPIPPRLIRDLEHAPVLPEWIINRAVRDRRVGPMPERAGQVLACAANGLSTKRTADTLGITYWTVQTHRSRLMFHLAAANMTHAVAIAIARGHLELPS